MSQGPSDSRNNSLSRRIELQHAERSPSYPSGQQVLTRSQSTLDRSADYSSERKDSQVRLIARIAGRKVRGRRQDPLKRTRPPQEEAEVRTDCPVRLTLRTRPLRAGMRAKKLLRPPLLRAIPRIARIVGHITLNLLRTVFVPYLP